jgi:hypothetical protein
MIARVAGMWMWISERPWVARTGFELRFERIANKDLGKIIRMPKMIDSACRSGDLASRVQALTLRALSEQRTCPKLGRQGHVKESWSRQLGRPTDLYHRASTPI